MRQPRSSHEATMKQTIDGIYLPNGFQVPLHLATQIGEAQMCKTVSDRLTKIQSMDPFEKQRLVEHFKILGQEKLENVTQVLRHQIFVFKKQQAQTNPPRHIQAKTEKQKSFMPKIENHSNSHAPILRLNYGSK